MKCLYDTYGRQLHVNPLFEVHAHPTCYQFVGLDGRNLLVVRQSDGTILPNTAACLLASEVLYSHKSKIFADPHFCRAILSWNCDAELAGLVHLAGSISAATLLDVGCGFGRLMIPLQEMGFAVFGVDSEPALVEYANKMRVSTGQGMALCADMESLSFTASIDMAFAAMNTVRYLEDVCNLQRHLQCMARSVRPGGIYAFHVAVAPASSNYRHSWRFVHEDAEYEVVWESKYFRRLRRQVIDEISLRPVGADTPAIIEHQAQIDLTSQVLADVLAQQAAWWSIDRMLSSDFLQPIDLSTAQNVWVVLRRNY